MTFDHKELGLLFDLLVDEAQRMDDDGREGAFDASSLKPIYDKILKELKQ